MKVRIDHIVDIPDGFKCRKCLALTEWIHGKADHAKVCANFNKLVFENCIGEYVKCRKCIDACLSEHQK